MQTPSEGGFGGIFDRSIWMALGLILGFALGYVSKIRQRLENMIEEVHDSLDTHDHDVRDFMEEVRRLRQPPQEDPQPPQQIEREEDHTP
jgi:hypothetical protein